jgi:phosphate transport system permease protein
MNPARPTPPIASLADAPEELSVPLPWRRRIFSHSMTTIAFLLTGLALLPLFAILIEIIRRGLPQLSWETLTALPAPVGMTDMADGFGNAIVGTLLMVGVATLISVPIGVLTAVFLSEFGQGSTIANAVRFLVTVLSGVPSIVVGVFAYGVIVLTTKEYSALAGSFALGVIMLPIVVLATEGALLLVPQSQRLASAALGANRLQTTFRIVIATALPAIMTGILLSIARAAGETAPLIFTALFTENFPRGLFSPAPSLSVLIYNYANSPFVEQNQMAWTAALVLLGLVLLLSVVSRVITRKRSDA